MSKKMPISEIPELMEIWDWDANEVSPFELGKRSEVKVWWICPHGHEHYQQTPRYKASRNLGCPKCNVELRNKARNLELIKQKGSIADTHPELILEWDYERNDILPQSILPGSHTKVWWKCKYCEKSFYMNPNSRTTLNYGCPECGIRIRANSKRQNNLHRKGSLRETHPNIAKEWDYNKNTDTPEDVHQGTADVRWWTCPYGHPSFLQEVRERVRRSQGCPKCQGEFQTSFPEQAIFYYIKKLFPEAQNRYTKDGVELDIFIKSLQIGIEYDGVYWHKNKKEKEQEKDAFFESYGIRIIHVKEYGPKTKPGSNSHNTLWVRSDHGHDSLNIVIERLAEILGTVIEYVDVQADSQKIWKEYLSRKKEKSLLHQYPHIAKEWDYQKNQITPDMVSPHSNKKVYWLCPKCGNSYQMNIGWRTGRNSGCPPCGFSKRNQRQHLIREKNQQVIAAYRDANPNATRTECSRAVGLSFPTVNKYWKREE